MDTKAALAEGLRELEAVVQRFPWGSRLAYGDFLAQTYYFVCHSTRLLAAAAARFPLDQRGQTLHARFAAHISEEKHHELLAEHDIRALGLSVEVFPERHLTRAFYEPQYYKIEHQGPMTLFGYILPLEAAAARLGGPMLAALVSAHGKGAVSFAKVHAQDDPEHLDSAFAAIDLATPVERSFIDVNLRQSMYIYIALLQEIAAAHGGS